MHNDGIYATDVSQDIAHGLKMHFWNVLFINISVKNPNDAILKLSNLVDRQKLIVLNVDHPIQFVKLLAIGKSLLEVKDGRQSRNELPLECVGELIEVDNELRWLEVKSIQTEHCLNYIVSFVFFVGHNVRVVVIHH